MQPRRLRNCRVIRGRHSPNAAGPSRCYIGYSAPPKPAPARNRAEALAARARAARSFVAPWSLPPSAGPFAVGDRVNARLLQMEEAKALKWYSAVVAERKRGNKYDVLYDDGVLPTKADIPAEFVRKEGPADGLIIKSAQTPHKAATEKVPSELHVLNTEGRWQPARSLYEYVQQNVVETGSSGTSRTSPDANSRSMTHWTPPKWHTASQNFTRGPSTDLNRVVISLAALQNL